MLKKENERKKTFQNHPYYTLTSILKLDQENDAAMEDWFVTTSQIHVFNIYFMGLTTEVQLK